MPKYISQEKRTDIIRHMQAGRSKREIAEWYFVCIRSVTRIWNSFINTGKYETKVSNCGRKPLVSKETMGRIVSKITEVPDITLVELVEEFNLPITFQALSTRLLNLGYSFKKNSTSKCKGKRGRYRSKGDLGIKSGQSRRG